MLELTACPQCQSVAEVRWRVCADGVGGADGPVEHARLDCINRHSFFLPAEAIPVVAAGLEP